MDFTNLLNSSYDRLYCYIDEVSEQIIKKNRITKSDEFKEELKAEIQIHIFNKLDKIKSARFPKTYLSSMIHNKIKNFMRDKSRYVERVNQAQKEFQCQHYQNVDFTLERSGYPFD